MNSERRTHDVLSSNCKHSPICQEDAKVMEEKDKYFYCMSLIWGHSRDALELLSEIAFTVSTVPHSNTACSTLDLVKTFNSIMLIKMNL